MSYGMFMLLHENIMFPTETDIAVSSVGPHIEFGTFFISVRVLCPYAVYVYTPLMPYTVPNLLSMKSLLELESFFRNIVDDFPTVGDFSSRYSDVPFIFMSAIDA